MTAAGKLTKGKRADVQPLVDKVVGVVSGHVHEERLRVYLFGSWSQGRALPESDLDIALDAGTPIAPSVLQKIADTLDELPTLRKVDIVDLQAVASDFRNRIMQLGELVYGK